METDYRIEKMLDLGFVLLPDDAGFFKPAEDEDSTPTEYTLDEVYNLSNEDFEIFIEALVEEPVAEETAAEETVGVDLAEEGAETTIVTANYHITAPGADIYDSQGLFSRVCRIGTIEELPVEIGDTFVDRGIAEKVQ